MMEAKKEIYRQHNVELKRFQRACDQILQLNKKLDDLSRRYMSAKENNNKLFQYSLRSRMLVVEGMLTSYCNYANVKKIEIMRLRSKLKEENTDEAVFDVHDEETEN